MTTGTQQPAMTSAKESNVSGVRDFHDVGAELHAHAGTMGNDGGIVFIGDAGAAGVQHGEERHTPFFGHTGDFTEVGEHIALVVVAEVHMHGNAVGTTVDGFLNGAYEAFLVGVAGQGRGSGKMDDQPTSLPSPEARKQQRHSPLCIRTASAPPSAMSETVLWIFSMPSIGPTETRDP